MTVYCPFCMREQKKEKSNSCCYCGKDLNYTGSYPQLPVGTILVVKYVLGAAIVHCGTYISYMVLDTVSGKRKVIKECFPSMLAERDKNGFLRQKPEGEEEYKRDIISFLEEVRKLRTFTELKCVCNVEAYFEANNTAYMVREYIEGEPITGVISEQGPFKMSDLEPIIKPLMEDIAQMHRMGFLHNEIEPTHIYVRDDGTPILLGDYSIRKTSEKVGLLTMPVFSPVEHCLDADQRGAFSDVYSMAATIYFCLTGEAPQGAIARAFRDEMVFPREQGIEINQRQNDALKKAMALKAENRTQTMEEFIEDLFGEQVENNEKQSWFKSFIKAANNRISIFKA